MGSPAALTSNIVLAAARLAAKLETGATEADEDIFLLAAAVLQARHDCRALWFAVDCLSELKHAAADAGYPRSVVTGVETMRAVAWLLARDPASIGGGRAVS